MTISTWNEKGWFCGYASVFHVADAHGDVVVPGAFRDTLAQWQERNQWPKLLWQHNSATPVGRITALREDSHGLYLEGQLLLDLTQGREAHVMLENGILDGLSIGFKPVQHRRDSKTNLRLLEVINLFEISLVTFPANAQAHVHRVKMHKRLGQNLQALHGVMVCKT